MTPEEAARIDQRRRLQMRLADLRSRRADLRQRVGFIDEQIALTLDELDQTRRGAKPPCGTEKGYQWHRYHDRDNWPLPADDPCGCRAAHRDFARAQTRVA